MVELYLHGGELQGYSSVIMKGQDYCLPQRRPRVILVTENGNGDLRVAEEVADIIESKYCGKYITPCVTYLLGDDEV